MTMDPRHWTTEDGHRYVSVPVSDLFAWKRAETDRGIVYTSGPYQIRRWLGSSGNRHYTLYRDGEELTLAFYGRLKDAKLRAVSNAEGRDEVNVA